ncbi:MAG: O-antigen ligase family protein [bacterium]
MVDETRSPYLYLKWERWIACLVIAFTPLFITPATADSYLLPKLVWLSCFTALWLFLIAAQPVSRKIAPTPLDAPLATLFILSLISTLIHYRTPLQIKALFNLALFIALFYCFRRFWRRIEVPARVVPVLMITAVLAALYGILQDYGIDFMTPVGGVRDWRAKVISTLGNPNFLAGYLGITLPVIVAYGLQNGARIYHFAGAGLAVMICAACHTVTFSVGTTTSLMGSLIVTLATALVIHRKICLPLARTFILIVLAALPVIWYLADNPYNSHGRSLYKEAWASPHWWSGMGARRFNWKTTRVMIDESPLTGIGFGNYLTVHEHYQGINYAKQWHAHDRDYVIPVDQPHFQLLETASEIGPLGVLALLWLTAAWNLAAWRRFKQTTDADWFAWGAYAGVWVALIHTFSDFPFHLPASSLQIALLGSYLVTPRKPRETPARYLPPWLIGLCFFFTLLVGMAAILQFRASQFLRKGIESRGFEAVTNLEASRSLDPFVQPTHYMLGVYYASLGWDNKAVSAFKTAIRLQEDILAHQQLAQIFLRQNDLPSAIQQLERVIELNPVFPGRYHELIDRLKKAGRADSIADLERKARELEEQLKKQ